MGSAEPVSEQSFNTQPPVGGWRLQLKSKSRPIKFQHAAARRRLDMTCSIRLAYRSGFNTQPPVGGWLPAYGWVAKVYVFQHAAARRRLETP